MRHLILVLGDQLDAHSAAFDGFDAKQDAVWMVEVKEESTKVWSTQPRTAVFLACMRHFRDELRGRGFTVYYRQLGGPGGESFAEQLADTVSTLKPKKLIMVEAGEWSVAREIEAAAAQTRRRAGPGAHVQRVREPLVHVYAGRQLAPRAPAHAAARRPHPQTRQRLTPLLRRRARRPVPPGRLHRA